MIPRLGNKYDIEIEITAKPKEDYMSNAYFELNLPLAPAIMVGDDIIVEGSDVEKDKLETANCRHLGFPESVTSIKGFIVQWFKR